MLQNQGKYSVSIVIPVLNDLANLKSLLDGLELQSYLPNEVVIVDSSTDDAIKKFLANKNYIFTVSYYRIGRAFPFDRFLKRLSILLKCNALYIKKFPPPRAFPYEATNYGVKHAKNELIAFLDTTTIPNTNWLFEYVSLVESGFELIFGVTKYFSKSNIQKYIHWSTWGNRHYETMPGSLIFKDIYMDDLYIKEGVRSGGDVHWRYRAKIKTKWHLPRNFFLRYESIPNNFFRAAYKAFIYQIYGARSDIQKNTRDAYTGLILFLSILIIPKWNSLVGWENSILFIPNITKIYSLSIVVALLVLYIFSLENFKYMFSDSFLGRITKFSLAILTFTIVIQWNFVIAGWIEESVLFVPHITKTFLFLIFITSFFYRGIYLPLSTGIHYKEIFPLQFIPAGLVGVSMDLIKAPGYVLGSIYTFLIKLLYYFNLRN